ncbi:RING-type E3 ubiquitin transferase [Ranunculus cassubicifolius]
MSAVDEFEYAVSDDDDSETEEESTDEEEEYIPTEIVQVVEESEEAEIIEREQVSTSNNNDGVSSSGNDSSDAAWCPICYDNWSSQGPHQVCCLPCGHVYGFSCIEKWIRQYKRNSRECPQCKRICKLKDIIKLYVPRLAVIEGEQEKKLLSLQAEIEFLKLKVNCLDNFSEETRRRNSEIITTAGDSQGQMLSGYGGHGSSFCNFELEDEFQVVGARIFDIDASNRVLLLARRLPGSCGDYVFTKISLVYPYDSENIQLPPSTKAVKDVHISPCAERLALFASLGKKLSILSMASNNVVVTYNLPGPAWSCSWDLNSQHHVYAGLQMENQDNVCVSLAYSSSSDDIVASFRPKVQTSSDIVYTQATQAVPGRGVQGTHVHLKRSGHSIYQKQRSCVANVSDVRMLKSAIVNIHNHSLFACGDEATRGLSIYELPSLRVMQSLEPHTTPILDVKFAATLGPTGLLGCTSDDKLQLFSAKFS